MAGHDRHGRRERAAIDAGLLPQQQDNKLNCHQPKASDCSRLGLTDTTSGSRTDWFLPSTIAHADGHALEDKKMRPSGSVPWRRRIDACQPEQSRLVSGV